MKCKKILLKMEKNEKKKENNKFDVKKEEEGNQFCKPQEKMNK